MSITMPETIAYGKVVGRFIQAVGDTADVNVLPDVVSVPGNVTFTALAPITRETLVAPPTTVVRTKIECSINEAGLLVSDDGTPGVWLVAGSYRVTYSTSGAAIPAHDIVVTADHNVDNPLDLTVAMPPGGPVLTPSEYAELSARLDTLLPEVSWAGDVLTVDGESSPPLTGPTGPAVSILWDEDILVVDGESSPPLTGPTGPMPGVVWVDDVLVVDGESSPPLTGPTGPSVAVGWVDDVLVVDGESSPPLTGPVSTVPGPPNVLSKGTVTTSAPGSDADFTITGETPAQTLSLVLPRGEQGPQGLTRYLVQDGAAYPARPFPTEVPVTFVGSANPDTLGVMVVGDSWINTAADQVTPYVKHYDGAGSPNGVVAAQIGSRYIDVNATCGAVEWTKMSGAGNTGWKVSNGDTGLRSLDQTFFQAPFNVTGPASQAYLRRINDVVYLSVLLYTTAPLTAGNYAFPTIPHLWGLGANMYAVAGSGPLWSSNNGAYLGAINNGSVVIPATVPAGTPMRGTLTQVWAAPWPTTLPGMAV